MSTIEIIYVIAGAVAAMIGGMGGVRMRNRKKAIDALAEELAQWAREQKRNES